MENKKISTSEFLDRLFPHNQNEGFPSFSASGAELNNEENSMLQSLIDKLYDQDQYVFQIEDINEILSFSKKIDYSETNLMLTRMLEKYFGSREITLKLYDGNTTIFPHFRFLEDIDYDLLEPVINRSNKDEF